MKVAHTFICVSCDEVVEESTLACPSCTGTQFLSLSRIIRPLQTDGELKIVRMVEKEKSA